MLARLARPGRSNIADSAKRSRVARPFQRGRLGEESVHIAPILNA